MKHVYYSLYISLCLLFISSTAWAQFGVEGIVKDDNGEPLTGVNIVIKNTDFGSITDSNGEFSTSVPNKNSTLIFSFIGFETIEFPLNGKSNIIIEMKPSTTDLDQVVISASRKKEKILEALLLFPLFLLKKLKIIYP